MNHKVETNEVDRELVQRIQELEKEKETMDEKFKENLESEIKLQGDQKLRDQVKLLDMQLVDKQSEINKLSHNKNSFGKDERMMKQMLKANEVRIRSVEKENSNLKKKLDTIKTEKNESLQALKELVKEIQIRGGKKSKVKSLLGDAGKFVEIDSLFREEASMDTEEELGFALSDKIDNHIEKPGEQEHSRNIYFLILKNLKFDLQII